MHVSNRTNNPMFPLNGISLVSNATPIVTNIMIAVPPKSIFVYSEADLSKTYLNKFLYSHGILMQPILIIVEIKIPYKPIGFTNIRFTTKFAHASIKGLKRS